MPVTFVLGRAGSGKSFRILRRLGDACRAEPLGAPIYWLVPRQATFLAERELTGATGGFSRVHVVSFDLLGRMIGQECGGSAVPEVTDLGRQMILGHLLRRHQSKLRFFASVAHRPGLAAELDATFAEFERSGKSASDLSDLIDHLRHADPTDAQGPSLQAKLLDLQLLYDAYAQYLGQERLDPHRRLTQVLTQVEQCSLVRNATVYVDGFADFTDHERRVLASLGKACAAVFIALTLDPASPTIHDPHQLPDDLSLFHATEQAYRRLWFAMSENGVALNDPIVLNDARRFTNAPLAQIERTLFDEDAADSPSGKPVPPLESEDAGAAVRLIEAPDVRAEVDAAARQIAALLREGTRLREIAVLVRDLTPYATAIETSFGEHGIAHFIDRRRTAAHHPLLQFIRSIFQIARGGWPYSAVMIFLKSGLAGVSLAEADEVENYLLQHRLRGAAWDDPEQWQYQRRTLGRQEDDPPAAEQFQAGRVDAIRREIVGRLRSLLEIASGRAPVAVRALAVEVFNVFEQFGVGKTVSAWAAAAADAGELEEAAEHEQVWAELVDLFEQMVDLLGDEPVTPADFVDVLESGLERFSLALTPPTLDQVLVGQVDRTRLSPVKAVLVLGLNQGQFPRVHRDASLLSHAERRELRRRQIELDPDPERRQLDERLLGYVALTRASDRLYLSRPLIDDNARPAEPSPYWQRVRAIFPQIEPRRVERESARDLRHVSTPRQLLTAVLRWARESTRSSRNDAGTDSPEISESPPAGASGESATLGAIYQWLATREDDGSALAALRRDAWAALAYTNDAILSPEVARRLFPAPLRATARQLETFAACPFQHWARYGLRLGSRESHDVTAADMSQVYHEVLEIVAAELLESKRHWKDLSPDEAGRQIREYAAAIGQQLRGELMLSTARNRYLLDRIERTLAQVVCGVKEALSRGTFAPEFAGVRFGDAGRVPALRVPTPGGREVFISGQIDRIDVAADPVSGASGAAAFDYKLGGGALSAASVYHGLSLQLLTYLLLLEAHGEQLAGRPLTPAAAFYYRLLRGLESVDHPADATDPAHPDFHLKSKPRGLFHAGYLSSLDAAVAPGEASKVVQAHLKKDGQFGHRDRSDVADAHEFTAILGYVRRRLGELADEIMAGEVSAAPYRVGRKTPCPQCDYRSVCRFEPGINHYRHLPVLSRTQMLERVTGRPGGQGNGD